MADADAFLSELPLFADFEAVADPARYRPLPEGWALAVADVVDSTGAIEAGRYKAVNMAGAAVISAVLNGIGRMDLPFVFGGDGASVAVPPEGIDAARTALSQASAWAEEELGLDLRAALVPVADIRAAGHDVKAARFQASSEVTFAMFAGGGSSWAEAQMKDGRFAVARAAPGSRPDLTGLSCRWSPISSRNGQIVSVIVVPGPAGDGESFGALVSDVVHLTGDTERDGHPVPSEGPALRFSLRGIAAEARAQTGLGKQLRQAGAALAGSVLIYVFHRLNRKIGRFDARQYARDVALNTDFRKFDDGLKMTLDIDAARLAKIEARLAAAAEAGVCRYGIHRQGTALVTCLVPTPMSRDHMHFVDGGAGGYASAASRLKAALKQP
jgi:Protein of unknown function (DUF3095)